LFSIIFITFHIPSLLPLSLVWIMHSPLALGLGSKSSHLSLTAHDTSAQTFVWLLPYHRLPSLSQHIQIIYITKRHVAPTTLRLWLTIAHKKDQLNWKDSPHLTNHSLPEWQPTLSSHIVGSHCLLLKAVILFPYKRRYTHNLFWSWCSWC